MKTSEAIKILEKGVPDYSDFKTVKEAWDAADLYNQAIKHAIEHMRRFQWQPIETYTPRKDPNVVLVFDRIPVAARYDIDGQRWMMGGKFLDQPDYFVAIRVKPTHWMPLPDAPESEG